MWFSTLVLRNICRRKLRSCLTGFGVAIAVGAVVALVGVSNGFERTFLDLYATRDVDLVVIKAGVTERLTSTLREDFGARILALPEVAAVEPGLVDVVSFEEAGLIGVPLQGWSLTSRRFEQLEFTGGRRFTAADQMPVLLGAILARNLGKKVGQAVEIDGEPFTIVGIYQSFNVFENGSAVVRIADLQNLMDRQGQVTGFDVVLRDAPDKQAQVQAVCAEIESMHDEDGKPLKLAAMPMRDHVATTYQIRLVRQMAWVVSAIAILIGSIGVLNTMIMSVFERVREIGILRALGWRKSRVVRMILMESLMVSLAGAVLGTLGGVGLVRLLSLWPSASGFVDGAVAPQVIGQGFLIALCVALIGGTYPALRGAALSPTEALRHE